MSKLRTFLQQERGARGWSKTDLAEKSGIPLSTLSRYESPRHAGRPSHDNVLLLARAFDKEPGDILRFIGYPRRAHDPQSRDAEWATIRDRLEGDPRARRIIELYSDATDEDRDIGVELLEAFFTRRPRRAS
jgi:transcriptional regulator with XRE-family HTH domain